MELSELSSLTSASQTLMGLISTPTPPQSIYVQASSNTEVTLRLIREILDKHPPTTVDADANGYPWPPHYVQVNMDEMLSSRNLFQAILNHLALWNPPYRLSNILSWNGQIPSSTNHVDKDSPVWDYLSISRQHHLPGSKSHDKGLLSQRKSSSFDGFCQGLRIICQELSPREDPFPRFIIINRPEFLRSWKEFNFLTSFTRLAELAGCSIHTIFVSPLPWHKLRPRYGAVDPISISIPRLSEADLVKVLVNEGPPDLGKQITNQRLKDGIKPIFHNFVQFIVSTFNSQTSADIYELSILVNRLWPGWIAQMDERDLSINDTAKIILLFKPIIELETKSYGTPVWHLPSFLTKPPGLDMEEDNEDSDKEEKDQEDEEDEEADDDTMMIVGSTRKKKQKRINEEDKKEISPKKKVLLSPTKTRMQELKQAPFTTPSKPRHYQAIMTPSSFSTHNSTTIGSSSQLGGSTTSTRRHQFTNHLTPTTPRVVQYTSSSTTNNGPIMYQRQKTTDILALSLPLVSRFLIIAAFIASFNPNRADLILFFTSHFDSFKKRKSRTPKKIQPGQVLRAKIRQRLLGPKSFTIGRLLAIFHAITDQEGVDIDEIDVLQQIGTLIQFKLILRAGIVRNDHNNNTKNMESIKLIISNLSSFNQSQILKISDSLNFNLFNRMFESED